MQSRIAISAALLITLAGPALSQDAARFVFRGKALVGVSDADMVASAYVDGKLGPREGKDSLFLIPLGAHPRDLKAIEIPATNSVAGPPAAVATTPDGRFAFVVETFGPRPDGDAETQTFKDLPVGSQLTVFDIANPKALRQVQALTLPKRPTSVSVNPAGTLLAVTVHPAGGGTDTPLLLIPFADGRLGEPAAPPIPGWVKGNHLMNAEWHPSRPILALADATAEQIRFVEVAGTALKAWGNTVGTEKETYMLKFTPDGRHLVANALFWGPDVEGQWNEAPRGSVYVIRLEAGKMADGSVRHALVSRAMTGVSPEGLAVSPDGRWVVTTNLERSYLPWDDKRLTPYSSLSLFALDADTGQLAHKGDFAYDGILPEAAAFDASSTAVAVVTYDHFDEAKRGGSVDFWRLTGDPLDPNSVVLVKTDHSVPVTRGAHSMVLVK
jgi:DNA-binding beta-propeller fold protein YncE